MPVTEEDRVSIREPAFLTVAQVSRIIDESSARQTLVTTIVTTNRGKGKALNALQVFPFNPARLELLDVQTSRREVWVSRVLTNTLEIHTGPLAANGGVITTTVRFHLLAPFEQSSPPAERISFTWQDGVGGGSGQSNALQISSSPDGLLSLLVEQVGEHLPITGSGTFFIPGEPVSIWYNALNGQAVAVTATQANRDGVATVELKTTEMASGVYTLVMHGRWSNLTGVAAFSIVRGGENYSKITGVVKF